MKKGFWSPEEDEKLKAFITNHGVRTWKDVPLQAGLDRSGKSCRLRWLNYLRPDIKIGKLSAEEKELVLKLHSIYGNRWTQIAKRIPGRTDNGIKNFWNSVVHKSAKTWLGPLCLEQVTSYRLAMPFKMEFSEPKVESATKLQALAPMQKKDITLEECGTNCSSYAYSDMDSMSYESFYDYALLQDMLDPALTIF